MKHKIEFKPGYYEWHLFIDNKMIFNINDPSESVYEIGSKNYASDLIEVCKDFTNSVVGDRDRFENENHYLFYDYDSACIFDSLTKQDLKIIEKIIDNELSRYNKEI